MSEKKQGEALITCPGCSLLFDENERSPKFLFCCHTVCLKCVEENVSGFCLMIANHHLYQIVLLCPACNEHLDVSKLTATGKSRMLSPKEIGKMFPNNIHALHLVKLFNAEPSLPEMTSLSSFNKSWCLTCGCIGKLDCFSSGHSTFAFEAASFNNVESLIGLAKEAKKTKKKMTKQLTAAIGKSRSFHTHLSSVSEALRCLAMEVQGLTQENDIRLALATSMVESVDSLLDTDEPMDESMVLKVDQFVNIAAQELKSALDSAPLIHQPKTRIQVDTNSGHTIVDSGWKNDVDSCGTLRNLLLLRHVIFSALRHERTAETADKESLITTVAPSSSPSSTNRKSYGRDYLLQVVTKSPLCHRISTSQKIHLEILNILRCPSPRHLASS